MAIPPFTLGYPEDGQSLGASKATIRNNLDGTFQTVAINHFDNNSTNAGKHKYIQLPTNAGPVATAAKELLLYNGTPDSTNYYLYYLRNNQATPSGQVVQMTRNEVPQATSSTNGYSWLPGGFLIQWGTSPSTSTSTTVNFSIPFPTAVFSVIPSLASSNSYGGIQGTPGLSSFVFTKNASAAGVNISWIAIGK